MEALFAGYNPGQILRDYRLARHLTLREAAFQVGLDFSFLNKIELGSRKPSAENLLKLGNLYGIHLETLDKIAELFGLSRISNTEYLSNQKKVSVSSAEFNNTHRKGVEFIWKIVKASNQ